MGEEFDRMADLAAPFVTGPIPPEFGGDEDEEWNQVFLDEFNEEDWED